MKNKLSDRTRSFFSRIFPSKRSSKQAMVVIEERPFRSGVIEGFYGRPWTCEQRKELFVRMKTYGMNTYMYAPKDDAKHRSSWRQLYTVEEEKKLRTLIEAADAQGVLFVYAISPGLDIVFSSAADVAALKRKMKQVSKLGCKAFALLFDDIDPRLREPDSKVYKSSAQAQATLTNELFGYLKRTTFLFCPTEYCKTRAFPMVQKSEYLTTIGTMLHQDIAILWTGNKVIPQFITKESIEELSEVLQRKPILWDNIHANDYDHRRVFLGPYSGRPVELYPALDGVLTNPNCEFEANFIPVHTLGTWCQVASNVSRQQGSGAQDDGVDSYDLDDVPMEDVDVVQQSDMELPDCSMNIDLYPLTAADVNSVLTNYDPRSALKLAIHDWIKEFSLHKSASVKCYAKRNATSTTVNGQTIYSTGQYGLDITRSNSAKIHRSLNPDQKSETLITEEDLHLLVDMFYLPYEHGEKGNQLVEQFKWLADNSLPVDSTKQLPKEIESQWKERAMRFRTHCQAVTDLFTRLSKVPNESILFDLYPYVWDVKEIVFALESHVKWLLTENCTRKPYINIPCDEYQNFSYNGHDASSDYIEPWHVMFIGGLTVELHRLLPFAGGYVFLDSAPDLPTSDLFSVRPFGPDDKTSLYKLCSSFDITDELMDLEKEDLAGDKHIGPYLNICPESVFVVEHKSEICGFVAAAPDNKLFCEKIHTDWFPSMNEKYVDQDLLQYSFIGCSDHYPVNSSHIVMKILPKVKSANVSKRILTTALSVLKSLGSSAVYLELEGQQEVDLYSKLGFYQMDKIPDKSIVGRCL